VLECFETSGRNLLAAEAAAGIQHHVALSIVGTDRSDNGYFRAKVAQEKLIKTSRAETNFFFLKRDIASSSCSLARSTFDQSPSFTPLLFCQRPSRLLWVRTSPSSVLFRD
jgi:hypothetical protein